MYSQSITREHRTAFIIALDLSGSMCELVSTPEGERTKAEVLCSITNDLLFELIERARRSDGVRDYYDVAVIGYSGSGVRPLLGEKDFYTIRELAAVKPLKRERLLMRRLPDGSEKLVRTWEPVWITPTAEGQTPMYELFCHIHHLVQEWCNEPQNRQSYPPTIFHITDGEASDCTPEALQSICSAIREEGTADGGVLLLNSHITCDCGVPATLFPAREEELGEDRYARLLYTCSIPMPSLYEAEIRRLRGDHATGPFRGMSYNCSAHELVSLLNIGSISLPLY